MTLYTPGIPLRTLDPDKGKAIKYFYSPSSGGGFFLATFLPITLSISLGGFIWGIWNGLIAGVAIAACWVAILQMNIRKKIARAGFIYQYGIEEELTFTGIASNYGIALNNMPQQVISLLRNGSPIVIKTFNAKVINAYSLPKQIAYTHARYPDVMVPSGLFLLQQAASVRSANRILFRWLSNVIPFALVFGLTFFIYGELGSNNYTYAQPDALIYRQADKLVLSSVITHFQANQMRRIGPFGYDACYAEGLDVLTGKSLWKVAFHAKDNTGRDVGGARLLGQSDKYLFFLRNELYIIDKSTGEVAARNDDFPAIKNNMPKAPVMSYEDDAGFTYNDSLQALIVKGSDGLFYAIDGLTLKIDTINIPKPDAYFINKFKYRNIYKDQITSIFDDGRECIALLDEKDTAFFANNIKGLRERSPRESIRRVLYSCPSNIAAAKWAIQNSGIFLFGGFLADPSQLLGQPVDAISNYASYQALAKRYNHTNPPMRIGNGGFIIMHQTSIEPNATLLFTGISVRGSTLWQVSTEYATVPFIYHDAEHDELFLAGSTKGDGTGKFNQVTCLDLKTGATSKYGLR